MQAKTFNNHFGLSLSVNSKCHTDIMKSTYSIKDLERLSGIKAHTIRIWEQRHHIITPKRTDTNIRFYEDKDLKKLLNVSFLVQEGVKISKVATLNDEELSEMVQQRSHFTDNYTAEINALKMAMFEYDDDAFKKAFNESVDRYGEEETFTSVIGGFISQLGFLWQTNTVNLTHEHFVSNLIKQKIFAALDRLPESKKEGMKSFLLYLPGKELHEIGLLYLAYLLKKKGQRIISMGQNTPNEYLVEVYDKTKFDHVISIFTVYPHSNEVEAYLEQLKHTFGESDITFFICGAQLIDLIDSGYHDDKFHLYRSVQELAAHLPV